MPNYIKCKELYKTLKNMALQHYPDKGDNE